MAGKKTTSILLSKTDFTQEEADILSDAEAWKIIYSIPPKTPIDNRLQICFTGFGQSHKQALEGIAEANGLRVVMSVTAKLAFLCCGENAGPAKKNKAFSQSVDYLTEDTFLEFISNANKK
jgi:NAD-dependent DNA ligase